MRRRQVLFLSIHTAAVGHAYYQHGQRVILYLV